MCAWSNSTPSCASAWGAGSLALALATLDTWTRPAYLKKNKRMRELMPEPMRMAVGRGYYWRRDEYEAFADLLLASMRPARPAVRAD